MATHSHRSKSPLSVLVPLDGSVRAEGALRVARQLAQCLGADIVLARVTPLVTLRFASADAPLPAETYQQLVDDQHELAHEYLLRQGQLLHAQGISVKAILAAGNTASTLLDICTTEQVGLVVMTTHGRTGLARFALGSVADQLVRDSRVPVLLLRSYSSPSSAPVIDALEKLPAVSWHLDRVLVALDGSELSESVLPLVRELAGVVFHHITLQRVLPLTAAVPYRASVRKYLEAQECQLRAELAGRPCEVTSRLCEGVVPSEKIVEVAEEEGCLVVMATHGWGGGMKRLMLGSVTSQVVHTAHVPVLVVHAADQKSLSEHATQKALSADILLVDSLAD